jgi:hypothetical protein
VAILRHHSCGVLNYKILFATVLVTLMIFQLKLVNAVEVPSVKWSKTYGAYEGLAVIQTKDEGYAIAGVNATYSLEGRGYGDYTPTLIKTDSAGELEWKKTYGSDFGVSYAARSIVQTGDLGYALSGDGNWLLKTDAEGNVQWSKNFESFRNFAVIQAINGGYVLAGHIDNLKNSWDAMLLKIDEKGNMLWNRTFSSVSVAAHAVIETNDEGYALTGEWDGDFWFAKIDPNGNIMLNKTYHFSSSSVARSIAKTTDDGFILAGNDGESAFMVKVDSEGIMQWSNHYDNPPVVDSSFFSVSQTADGGYIAAGTPALIRTDAFGNVHWKMTGEALGSATNYVIVTDDDGYAVVGGAHYAAGLVKFASETSVPENSISTVWLVVIGVVISVTVSIGLAVYLKMRRKKA